MGRKEFYFILFGARFTSMHVLSVHYVTIFCFLTLSSPFRNVFSVTYTTSSNSSFLILWIF